MESKKGHVAPEGKSAGTAAIKEALSLAEQNVNKLWFTQIKTELFPDAKEEDEAVYARLKALTEELCERYHVILETNPKGQYIQTMQALKDTWVNGRTLGEILLADEETEAELKKQLEAWAQSHQALNVAAAERAKQMAARDPGIVSNLKAKQSFSSKIWCQDLDIQTCLSGLMLRNSGEITQPGHYLLPPISIVGDSSLSLAAAINGVLEGKKFHLRLITDFVGLPTNYSPNVITLKKIEDRIFAYKQGEAKGVELQLSTQEKQALVFPSNAEYADIYNDANKPLCDKIATALGFQLKVPGEITLELPVNDGGSHWRVATVVIKNCALTRMKIWDSMEIEAKGIVARNMQATIDGIADNSFNLTLDSAKIQTNKWSCGDFAIRKCLQNMGEDPKAQTAAFEAIRKCSSADPLGLRDLIIQQILETLRKDPQYRDLQRVAPQEPPAEGKANTAFIDKIMSQIRLFLKERFKAEISQNPMHVVAILGHEDPAAAAGELLDHHLNQLADSNMSLLNEVKDTGKIEDADLAGAFKTYLKDISDHFASKLKPGGTEEDLKKQMAAEILAVTGGSKKAEPSQPALVLGKK